MYSLPTHHLRWDVCCGKSFWSKKVDTRDTAPSSKCSCPADWVSLVTSKPATRRGSPGAGEAVQPWPPSLHLKFPVLSRDWRIEPTWKHRSILCFAYFQWWYVSKYVSPDFWIWYPHRGVVTDTAAERRPAVLQCCSVLKYELQQSNPVILIQVRHSEWSLKCEAIKCSVAGRR